MLAAGHPQLSGQTGAIECSLLYQFTSAHVSNFLLCARVAGSCDYHSVLCCVCYLVYLPLYAVKLWLGRASGYCSVVRDEGPVQNLQYAYFQAVPSLVSAFHSFTDRQFEAPVGSSVNYVWVSYLAHIIQVRSVICLCIATGIAAADKCTAVRKTQAYQSGLGTSHAQLASGGTKN